MPDVRIDKDVAVHSELTVADIRELIDRRFAVEVTIGADFGRIPVSGVEILGAEPRNLASKIVLVPAASATGPIESLANLGVSGVVLDFDGVAPSILPGGPVVWVRAGAAPWADVFDHFRSAIMVAEASGHYALPDATLGDLDRVANGLALMLGGPVIIENAKLEVISYSAYEATLDEGRSLAIVSRRMPEEWEDYLRRTGALDALIAGVTVIDVPDGPFQARRRLLTSLHYEGRLLGILWVAEGNHTLPPEIADLMLRAGEILLPHLRHYQLRQRSQDRRRGRDLASLLEGTLLPRKSLVDLGLGAATAYAVIAFRRADGKGFGQVGIGRVIDAANLLINTGRFAVATAPIDETVYCLVGLSTDTEEGTLGRLTNQVALTCQRAVNAPLHVATSRIEPNANGIRILKSEVDRLLTLMSHSDDGRPRTVTSDEGMVELMLDAAQAAAEDQGVGYYHKLARLEAHDSAHQTDLTQTLAEYLHCQGNVAAVADHLFVHVTTVRYRLRRVFEVSGIRLDSTEEMLLCALMLRKFWR